MAKYKSSKNSSKNLGMNLPKMSKQSIPQQAKSGGMKNPVSKCAKGSY